MPDWQPNWDDVVFDHAKAQGAVDECNRAAGALDTVLTGLDAAHRSLETDGAWTGGYRDDYGAEVPDLTADASATRDALRSLASSLATAMAAATSEQQRRVADRERWRAERDRELATRGYHRLANGKLIPI
ncbi:MAG: hypothetical protein ACRDZN_04145 [Acidimicrobiales bacterium]